MPAVDDGQGAPALLHQASGHEILVADAAGHGAIEVGHDRAKVCPLVGDAVRARAA